MEPFNAHGNNITVVDGAGGLTLGNISAGGNLDVTSTDGDISQAGGTTITVHGATTADAGSYDITLDGPDNDFVGPFNAVGGNVTVNDANDLLIGVLEALSDLNVTTQGNMTETAAGSMTVGGNTILFANRGKIALNATGNIFSGSFVAIDDTTRNQVEVIPPPPPSAPVPPASADAGLDAPTVTSLADVNLGGGVTSGGSDASSAPADASGSSTGLSLSVLKSASETQTGLIAVSVPKGTSTSGSGFSFPLPEKIVDSASTPIQVSLPDGSPLPAWLQYDAAEKRFVATAVPDGAFPITVVVSVSGTRTFIVISERTAK
ncbi:MAG: hypothetical protein KF778_14970 [Rhodocyclaceae bacterium]|nr:hypothetical protein [Rhodocyclaceae bacterium]